MKKIYMAGRVFIVFIPASYFTNLLYRDFFIQTEGKILLFLVWGFLCLYLIITSFQLIIMFTGRQYKKYKTIAVVRIKQMRLFNFLSIQIGLKRHFVVIRINDKERIVSGIFWRSPTSILVYKNAFDTWKT